VDKAQRVEDFNFFNLEKRYEGWTGKSGEAYKLNGDANDGGFFKLLSGALSLYGPQIGSESLINRGQIMKKLTSMSISACLGPVFDEKSLGRPETFCSVACVKTESSWLNWHI